jgi:hypothetical protein
VKDVGETDAQTRMIEEAIGKIGASITLLGDTTRLVSETAESSSNAIVGVQHGTATVVAAIARIGQVTEETAMSANSVSDSVFGQASDVSRLSDDAGTLTNLAGALHDAVGRFRVDDPTVLAEAEPIQLRKYPRFRVHFPLSYTLEGQTARKIGRARDIGGNGLCFESDERLRASATLTLGFELQAGVKLEVRGRVLSVEGDTEHAACSYRVEFLAMPDAVRECILTYILEARRNALTLRREVAAV